MEWGVCFPEDCFKFCYECLSGLSIDRTVEDALVSPKICKREIFAVFLCSFQITTVIFCKFDIPIVVLSAQLDKDGPHVQPVQCMSPYQDSDNRFNTNVFPHDDEHVFHFCYIMIRERLK